MIRIDRYKLIFPNLEDPRLKLLIEGILKEKDVQNWERYKSYFKKELEALKKHYHDKCAYCELKPGELLELDHYRPRTGLKDDKSHPGYYWLLYEWTNLVPACSVCNKAKSNHFPIDQENGKRVIGPPVDNGCLDMNACKVNSKIFLEEIPLLLHPEVDEPEVHFIFLSTGKIQEITLKGKTTIEVCKLNRHYLIVERKRIIDKFFKEVIEPLRLFEQKKIGKDILINKLDTAFSRIKKSQEPRHPFSRLGWFLAEKFEFFFIEPLKNVGNHKAARKLEEAYCNFRKFGSCKKTKN